MDNLNTHRPGALYEAFEPAQAKVLWDQFEFVYTPKHGSWLNVAEAEISVMSRPCLNRRIDSIDEVRSEVGAWQAYRDRIQAKVDWQFTSEDAAHKAETSLSDTRRMTWHCIDLADGDTLHIEFCLDRFRMKR